MAPLVIVILKSEGIYIVEMIIFVVKIVIIMIIVPV